MCVLYNVELTKRKYEGPGSFIPKLSPPAAVDPDQQPPSYPTVLVCTTNVHLMYRRWRARLIATTAYRRSALSLDTETSALNKRVALAKWHAAHLLHLARKTEAVARRSRFYAMPRLGLGDIATMGSAAVARVSLRHWHRCSAARSVLRRVFCAWTARVRASRSVEVHFCHALAKQGLSVWRQAAREARIIRTRDITIALIMSRAVGRRRLCAWRERRRRRADALRVAEDHWVRGGAKQAVWRRSECARLKNALRAWRKTARAGGLSRRTSLAVALRISNSRRTSASGVWRVFAHERRRYRRLLSDGEAHCARCMVRDGLRRLRHGTLDARACRDALNVGHAHWKRRRETLAVGKLR